MEHQIAINFACQNVLGSGIDASAGHGRKAGVIVDSEICHAVSILFFTAYYAYILSCFDIQFYIIWALHHNMMFVIDTEKGI
tara:strand:- start:352 stop:597 length:246 start_codon:yes stop_codon:yes gene_type:complete